MLLYLFIWRIVRSAAATRPRLPQESMILSAPSDAAPLEPQPGARGVVVLSSPALDEGAEVPVDSLPVTIGRGGGNDVSIDGDEFASSRHARFEPRRDGVYVEDAGSTNGTFVNGARVTRRGGCRRATSCASARLTSGSRTDPPPRSAVRQTDTGRKRRRNEDSLVCDPPLFAVADGMGGAQAGELASGLAAAVLERSATASAARSGWSS